MQISDEVMKFLKLWESELRLIENRKTSCNPMTAPITLMYEHRKKDCSQINQISLSLDSHITPSTTGWLLILAIRTLLQSTQDQEELQKHLQTPTITQETPYKIKVNTSKARSSSIDRNKCSTKVTM